jgi:uncharacterized protein YkwD
MRRSRLPSLPVSLSLVAALACTTDGPTGPGPDIVPEVEDFAALVNAHRVGVGCPELAWNGGVAAVAQAHSEDMVDRGFFSHTNPDGKSPFDRLADAGLGYASAAENIAYGYPTAPAVLAGWLGSSGHKANIENCALTEHGVGLEGTHWTHLFIRPPRS